MSLPPVLLPAIVVVLVLETALTASNDRDYEHDERRV